MGQHLSGSTRIPVGEMAKDMLGEIFPQLTAAQITALKTNKPVPPSAEWEDEDGNRPGALVLEREIRASFGIVSKDMFLFSLLDETPLITCIMPFGIPDRRRLAQKAVNQFMRQVYPNKQLIIANATDMPVTTVAHPSIKEIQLPPGSIGALRNAALDAADGDFFMQWDDDDYYHPMRLYYQAYHAQNCELFRWRAILLRVQTRCDIQTGCAYLHHEHYGIPSSGLYPMTAARYPDASAGEDVEFWNEHWKQKTIVVDNGAFPRNGLSVVVYHGRNALPPEQFMKDYAAPEFHGKWLLGVHESEHLKAVLSTFGLDVNARPMKEAAAVG